MKPMELSQQIRRIASAIESSKNPSRELVARDIRNLIAAVAGENKPTDSYTKLRAKLKEKGLPKNYEDMVIEVVTEIMGSDSSERHRLKGSLEGRAKSTAKKTKE